VYAHLIPFVTLVGRDKLSFAERMRGIRWILLTVPVGCFCFSGEESIVTT